MRECVEHMETEETEERKLNSSDARTVPRHPWRPRNAGKAVESTLPPGLVGLGGASEALGVGKAAHTISLRVLDARGVALHPDAELFAKVEELFVGEPQLLGQLVYSWVLGQRGSLTLSIPLPLLD